MAAGSIVISLLLNSASFETDTGHAEKRLKAFEKQAEKAGKVLGAAIAAGATAAAVAFDQLVKGASEFKDFEEITGANAEVLASFAVAAGTAGTSMENIGRASVLLTKNLIGVDDESKAAGAALSALGVPIAEFKALDPGAQIEAVSKALSGFQDGAEKTAVAIALFGKAGAELLPFLKTLEEQGGRQVILTQEQIEAADAYADSQAKAIAQLKLYAQAAATQGLPALNALTEAASAVAAEFLGIEEQTKKLGANSAVADFAQAVAKSLAFVVDVGQGVSRVFDLIGKRIGATAAVAVAVATGEFKQAVAIAKQSAQDIEETLQRELFSSKLERALARQGASPALGRQDVQGFMPRLQLNFAGAAAKQAESDVSKYIQRLEEATVAALGLTAAEQAGFDLAGKKLRVATEAEAERIRALARGLDLLKQEPLKLPFEELRRGEFDTSVSPESARELERFNDEQERFNTLLAATPSAELERQRKDMELLAKAFESGTITANEFSEAASTRLGNVEKDLDKAKTAAEELGLTFSSAFEDAIVEGSKLSDVLKGLAQDILRIAVRKNVTEPLAAALTGLFAGSFHAGGIVGAGGAGGMYPALAFAGAPRYHAGGIGGFRPDEVPAVLQRGEEVLRRDDPRHRANMRASALPSAGMAVQVNVENRGTPQRVEQQRSRITPEGFVVDLVTRDIEAGGPISRSVQTRHGLSRQLPRRG